MKACPRCVLGADSQHSADDTDRKAAFALLTRLLPRLELPPRALLFGPATSYETSPLPEAISRRLMSDPGAELYVPLAGEPADWDLELWPLTPILERWGLRGRTPIVLVDLAKLRAVDSVTRRHLVLWAERTRVILKAAQSMPTWLAAVMSNGAVAAWASTAGSASEVGEAWATASEAPLVRGNTVPPEAGATIGSDELLTTDLREALIEIEKECDGPVSGFGARLKAMVCARSPEIGGLFVEPVEELLYCDRYLFSPLTVRLVAELVRGFCGAGSRVKVRTLPGRRDGRDPRGGNRLHDDWIDLNRRNEVLAQMLSDVVPAARVEFATDIPHRRRLDFKTRGRSGTIYLDQGVGSWKVAGRVFFDHDRASSWQVAELKRPFQVANGPEGTFIAIRLGDG